MRLRTYGYHRAGVLTGLLMMFVGRLVVAGVIAIAVLAVIYRTGVGRSRGGPNDQARQILDQRYAKGDIGDEEYQRIRRELS